MGNKCFTKPKRDNGDQAQFAGFFFFRFFVFWFFFFVCLFSFLGAGSIWCIPRPLLCMGPFCFRRHQHRNILPLLNCLVFLLQIWDFETGRPLEMAAKAELCTASCMMNDGERIVLGRTEKFGGGTTVVIWDLLANEAVRKMEYKSSVSCSNFVLILI